MEVLKKHFDTALESPEGIKKLRELILTLAMQGKLVPQDPNDPPASELLKEIRAEKERLIAEGKIKKQKELPEIKPAEVPYELPESWVWVRLGGISTKVSDGFHHSAKKLSTGVKYISATHIFNGRIEWNSGLYVSEKEYKELLNKTNLKKGDILIVNRGAGCGDAAIIDSDERFCFQNAAIIGFSQKLIYNKYILRNIHASRYSFLNNFIQGGAQPMLSNKLLSTHLFPFPPLAEQKRIVAKIDELMALCNKLEEQRTNRDQNRLAVHTSAINRLLTAADKKEFHTSWQFITRHFDPIYSVKENVAELKKAILTLAMQGKLVPQDANDQPASELLKEIQTEKEKLIAEGKIKKQKELPAVNPEEVPYEVPEGWGWDRLGNIVSKLGSGSTPRGGKEAYTSNGIMFFRSQNVYNDGIRTDKIAFIPIDIHEKMSNSKILPEDILFNITGGSLGRSALVPASFKEGNISQHVCIIRPIMMYPKFIHLTSLCSYFHNYIPIAITGGGREGLQKNKMELFPISIPPLAEQKRIVAKIDELMALCDKLENQIDQATQKQTALFNAVLAQV